VRTVSDHPYVVGLTGGIGSGKSAAADLFGALGAAVVDTDQIAHRLTAPEGAAMADIRAAFGAGVIAEDGSLNRPAMRALAFGDPAARMRLEGILHPMIRSESERLCVVDCPEEVQVARVMLRSGLEACQVRAIMAAQASRSARLAAADDVVDNAGSLEYLREQVAALHRTYLDLAAQAGGCDMIRAG
jgi:dephospho-CoA kinase